MRAAFPHLGITKHTPTASCPPPPRPSLAPLPSFPPPPSLSVCLCLCALCESLSLLITITVHSPLSPLPEVGEYNSIFLCALGNLYNSILNLNETKKTTHVEKTTQMRQHWCDRNKARNACLSFCFLVRLVSLILTGFSGGHSQKSWIFVVFNFFA